MNTQTKKYDYNQLWSDIYGDLQEIGPVHQHMKRILRHILKQLDYKSLLDVGCGFGHNLPLLCKGRDLERIAGIDISEKAISHMRKHFPYSFYQLDIQKERLQETWELIFCSLLLEHVSDDLAVLQNLRAMTAKYLLLCTIAGPFKRYQKWEEKMGHVRNYRIGELEAKLEQTGFSVQKSIYWGFPFYSPIARMLQNYMKPKNKMGIIQRFLAVSLYYLYFLNSSKKGDLLIILAKV